MLPTGPVELKHVKAGSVALLAPDTVRALRHRVTMKAQRVILLDEDVEAPIIRVPGVSVLIGPVCCWLVQRHLHSDRQRVTHNHTRGRGPGGAALLKVAITVRALDLLHAPGYGGA